MCVNEMCQIHSSEESLAVLKTGKAYNKIPISDKKGKKARLGNFTF